MATQGPLTAATIANDDNFGADWVDPTNAASSNNTYAVATAVADNSDYLRGSNFGFTVSGTILGFLVEVEAKTATSAKDIDVRLAKTIGGTLFVLGSAQVETTEAYYSIGGPTSLAGTTWTAAEVNASTFNVNLSMTFTTETMSVDHFRVTVYYTPAAPKTMTLLGIG